MYVHIMITQKELFEYWDKNYNYPNTCNLKEGENIINLIKQIPKIYVNKILLIIKYYLISINKKYMLSTTVLKINNYLRDQNINTLHILYGLVRDYWNILKENGHPSVAICYHNTNFDLYDKEDHYLNKMVKLEENMEPYPIGKQIPDLFNINSEDFVSEEISINI